MSWRRHRRTASDPEPWLRLLSPDVRDNPKSVAWAKAKLEHDRALCAVNRKLVDAYHLYRACPLDRCRRARRCAGRELLCYQAALPFLRQQVFPQLRTALRERQAKAATTRESSL